jgi:RNA polymerase sigma-70 factor (ECF subfamily)
LIEQLRAGDPDAIAALYHRYARSIHATAYRLMGAIADAEDVVHDVFVGLPRALRTFEGRGSLEGWLRQVATRSCLMRLRQRRRRGEVLMGTASSAGFTDPEEVVDRLDLERALAALPDHFRVVVVLREIEGYSHDEIGTLMGITARNSMIRLHRARKLLKRLLEEGE